MKFKVMLVCVCLLATMTSGCTSSAYGNFFAPVQTNHVENHYTIKIYTGGFAGPEFAKKDLHVEAQKFISNDKKYVDYKIISHRFELIPSGVTFIVEFIKES